MQVTGTDAVPAGKVSFYFDVISLRGYGQLAQPHYINPEWCPTGPVATCCSVLQRGLCCQRLAGLTDAPSQALTPPAAGQPPARH